VMSRSTIRRTAPKVGLVDVGYLVLPRRVAGEMAGESVVEPRC